VRHDRPGGPISRDDLLAGRTATRGFDVPDRELVPMWPSDLARSDPSVFKQSVFAGMDLETLLATGGDDKQLLDPDWYRVRGIKTEQIPDVDGRMKAVTYFSLIHNIPPEKADLNFDMLKAFSGIDRPEGAATMWGRIKDRYHNGKLMVAQADLAAALMQGRGDWEKSLAKIADLRKQVRGDYLGDLRDWYEKGPSELAEMLPMMLDVAERGGWGAMLGGAVAGTAMTAVSVMSPTIGEEAAIPAAFWGGVKLGGGIAGGVRAGEIEGGMALIEMLDRGIDPAIAVPAAWGVGVLNGAIEMLQAGTALRMLPGGKGIVKNAGRVVAARLRASGALAELAARFTAQYGTFITAETAQELLQESSNLVFSEFSRYVQEELGGRELDARTWAEVKEVYREVAEKSGYAFATMGVLPTAIGSAVQTAKPADAATPAPGKTAGPAKADDAKGPAKAPREVTMAVESGPAVPERPTEAPVDYVTEALKEQAQGRAQAGIDEALADGRVTPGVHRIASHLLQEIDPEFDADSALEVSAEVKFATAEVIAAEGLDPESPHLVTGEHRSGLVGDVLQTAVKLYHGHDAGTVVHEWYHRAWDRLSLADRGRFEAWHEAGTDERSVREHFAQEGRDFFFSAKLHERAGGVRELYDSVQQTYDRVRASLRKLIGRIRKLRGAALPTEIEALYRSVGEGVAGPAEPGEQLAVPPVTVEKFRSAGEGMAAPPGTGETLRRPGQGDSFRPTEIEWVGTMEGDEGVPTIYEDMPVNHGQTPDVVAPTVDEIITEVTDNVAAFIDPSGESVGIAAPAAWYEDILPGYEALGTVLLRGGLGVTLIKNAETIEGDFNLLTLDVAGPLTSPQQDALRRMVAALPYPVTGLEVTSFDAAVDRDDGPVRIALDQTANWALYPPEGLPPNWLEQVEAGLAANQVRPGTATEQMDQFDWELQEAGGSVFYHGAQATTDALTGPEIHFGSMAQAKMRRAGEDSKILAAHLDVKNPRRCKDMGGNWKKKIASAKAKGKDAIVYLNRYEGMTTANVVKAHEAGIDLDRLSDKEFKKWFPEAEDSYIVFSEKQVALLQLQEAGESDRLDRVLHFLDSDISEMPYEVFVDLVTGEATAAYLEQAPDNAGDEHLAEYKRVEAAETRIRNLVKAKFPAAKSFHYDTDWGAARHTDRTKPAYDYRPVFEKIGGQASPGTAYDYELTPIDPINAPDGADLGELSYRQMQKKAKKLGISAGGTKEKLADLIREGLRAKLKAARDDPSARRRELAKTEKAIRRHEVYLEFAQADAWFEGRRIDPDITYFFEAKYKGDVEGYTGKPGTPGYNMAMGRHVTYTKSQGQAWDDAAQEQGFEFSFDEFMASWQAAIEGDRAGAGGGLNEKALDDAVLSDPPDLVLLAEKRRRLIEGDDVDSINAALAETAAGYEIDQADIAELLIGEHLIVAPPPERHPGSMTFDEFYSKLGEELGDRNSAWMKRYHLEVAESPRQMHRRLKADYDASRNAELIDLMAAEALSDKDAKLTPEQLKAIVEIENANPRDRTLAEERQRTVGELVQLEAADTRVRARARGMVRDAYTAGAEEATAKASENYRQQRARAKARKELRAQIDQWIAAIRKPAGRTIAREQRQAIRHIQRGIDPAIRLAKTIHQRMATLEYLEANADATIPADLMKQINQMSVGEMTVAKLSEVAAEVARLRKQGRLKAELIEKNLQAEYESVRDIGVFQARKGGHRLRSAGESITNFVKEGPRRKLMGGIAQALQLARMLDWMDGAKGSFGKLGDFFYDLFYNQIDRGTNEEIRHTRRRMAAGKAMLESVGMSLEDLHARRTLWNSERLSVEQIVSLYNFLRNPLSTLAVTFGNYGTWEMNDVSLLFGQIQKMVDGDPKLKTIADFLIEDYGDNQDRLFDAFMEIEPIADPPPMEKNYTPMRRMEITYTALAEEQQEAAIRRLALGKVHAESGFMKSRIQDLSEDYQAPIRLDGWTLWAEQVAKQEHYINVEPTLKLTQRLMRDKLFKDSILDNYGTTWFKVLQQHVNSIADPKTFRHYDFFDRASALLRRNTAVAYLGGNLVVMLRQPVSFMLALADSGVEAMFGANVQFFTNPLATIEFVRQRSPQIEDVTVMRELEEMRRLSPVGDGLLDKVSEFSKRHVDVLFDGIRMFDTMGRVIAWKAVYDRAMAETRDEAYPEGNESEAIRQADGSVARTQPTTYTKDLPQLFKTGSELMNWMNLFTRQLNQLFNMGYDLSVYMKSSQYQKAFYTMASLSTMAWAIWMVSNRRLPRAPWDDPEGFAEDAYDAHAQQFLATIPIIGKMLSSWHQGYGADTDIPGVRAIADLVTAPFDAVAAIREGDDPSQEIRRTLEGLAIVAGVPYSAPRRVVQTVTNKNAWYLVGGPPKEPESKKPKTMAAAKRLAAKRRR